MEVIIESEGASWDGAHVRALSGREAISELFLFEVEVACDPGRGLPEEAYPGGPLTLVILSEGEEIRRVHGVIDHIKDRLDTESERTSQRISVAPRASRLALVETQEVFLDLDVPEIIRRKLARHGLGARDVEMRLLREYPKREIVVQYRESDLAFVSRLAEHLGISFFFDHEDGHDKIVFTDHRAGFRDAPGAAEVPFRGRGEARDVFALEVTSGRAPTAYVVHDYNYRKPLLDLAAHHALPSGSGGGVVEYGSHVKSAEEALAMARIRAEERHSRQRVFEGKSDRAALSAGHRMTLLDHPRLDRREALLFTEVVHTATLPLFDEDGSKARYDNAFTAVPGGVEYRPPRRTPRPRIHGVVTGIVQPGPDGDTGGIARLDAEGRYTVIIHFDTALPGEKKASHPVRMAQPFAGPNHGMHFPLRPGSEVLLAFADGDPDRPVIVGSVPNAAAPSNVNAASADRHRITSATGALIEIRDWR